MQFRFAPELPPDAERRLMRASRFVQLFIFQPSSGPWDPSSGVRVGQARLELATPRLSSACSNQLSYWPADPIGRSRPNSGRSRYPRAPREKKTLRIDRSRKSRSSCHDSRKEVIQPQVPLRLPCYDFTPVTSHSLSGCLLAVGAPISGATDSHGVTGGVYKARERIHPGVLIRDY